MGERQLQTWPGTCITQEIWLCLQVNISLGCLLQALTFFFYTVDSDVKQRIETDIRTAQQDMEMYEKEKVEINQGIKQIGEEDEVFKQRLVSLVFFGVNPVIGSKELWRVL